MKHKLLFYLYFSLFLSVRLNAQQENIWAFGHGAGIDFSTGSPVPIQTNMSTIEACASVCDANGHLLFYTEGSYIWNRNHDTMSNGYDLTGLLNVSPNGSFPPTQSTQQGATIVPVPSDPGKYYVFSLTAWTAPGLSSTNSGKLYYSIVDMSLNNGLGDVVPGSKGIFLAEGLREEMTAIAGDRCNFWLLVHATSSEEIKVYEITETGINPSAVVSLFPPQNLIGRSIIVAPDGAKVAILHGKIRIGDFDRSTGEVTNVITIEGFTANGAKAAFSPDGSKLYCYSNQDLSICQFDLSSSDPITILASKTEVAISCVGSSVDFKLGPDEKLYFHGTVSSTGGTPPGIVPLGSASLSRIAQPNLPGEACQYEPDVLTFLPGSNMKSCFPNRVPVNIVDSFFASSSVSGPCFANVNGLYLQAPDSVNNWAHVWNTGATAGGIHIDSPGTYWLNYYSFPCNFHTDTFHVSFPYGVLPTIHVDTACAGTTNGRAYAATFPGDTVTYQYTWINGLDTVSLSDTLSSVHGGNYTLLVHTTHCDTSLNFIIPEADYRVNFILSDTLLCMGDTLYVQNTSDAHFNQYAWYFGDGDSSLLADPVGHAYPHPSSYEIIVTGSGTICQDTAIKQLVVDSTFVPVFQMDEVAICVGDHVTFTLLDADTSFTGLYWNWGDESYLDATYESSFTHAFDQPGVWEVQVILNTRVCPDAVFTDTVHVHVLPEVNLGSDTSLCLDGHAVVLRNLPPAPDEPYHYLWSTGDTTAGLRVLRPGSYSLRITTEPLGCNSTDEIIVSKDCYTDIPNAFTPDSDGDNDYFFPRTQLSSSVSDFKMQVFNRWGQLVFEATSIEGRGWDGRFNDKDQPMGVYIYVLEVGYSNGRQEQYKGNVTLIR